LKAAEEQILKGADCIKLQPPPGYAGEQGGASSQKAAWFTKGTIERYGTTNAPICVEWFSEMFWVII
jgi:hypothetical protein